ncbi:MAG: LicD family protein [Erysipelotrichaceae bacterium]|nr:LicD family protein [Erysipelotrichaceae bacterium]
MNELQTRMLNMMKWFHQFCAENGLTYYMIGGTMLGAARHKGFIPWDDDIDVGLPRQDFYRLHELMQQIDDTMYRMESYQDGNDDFEYPYGKIYDTATTLIENRKKQPKRGIFLDVFPLDGIGNSMDEARKNIKPIELQLNLLAARSCSIRSGRSKLKTMAVRVLGSLPAFILNPQSLIRKIETLCLKRGFDEFSYVGHLVGNWRARELMPREVFGKPRLYSFESEQFYGVELDDEYLRYLYKDWQKLPPVEKQKSDHDFLLLDLNRSYLE